jgi:hypothetical protein
MRTRSSSHLSELQNFRSAGLKGSRERGWAADSRAGAGSPVEGNRNPPIPQVKLPFCLRCAMVLILTLCGLLHKRRRARVVMLDTWEMRNAKTGADDCRSRKRE